MFPLPPVNYLSFTKTCLLYIKLKSLEIQVKHTQLQKKARKHM